MKIDKYALATALAVGLTCAGTAVRAEDTIKMGGLATLEGAFTVLGEDSMRGLKLALKEH
ncbi:MAG: ABC transporter substrate-binding protein, partial [Methylobacteriaceae bacterium]|nr:ABC transporter substrate-binding protein [Methylobacteriaceae bacterium]